MGTMMLPAAAALHVDDFAAGIARRDRTEHWLANGAANLPPFSVALQLFVPAGEPDRTSEGQIELFRREFDRPPVVAPRAVDAERETKVEGVAETPDRQRHQPEAGVLQSPNGCLGPVRNPHLPKDGLHVDFHGCLS
jgi:hypothetical protein